MKNRLDNNCFKEFEIWIGNFGVGQGYPEVKEPKLASRVIADNFRNACLIHEHQLAIKHIYDSIRINVSVDLRWFYDYDTNSNSWTGKYYSSYEEALKSFECQN